MKILLNVLLAAILGASVFLAASLTASVATLPKVTSVKAYNIDDDEINLKWRTAREQTDIRLRFTKSASNTADTIMNTLSMQGRAKSCTGKKKEINI